MEKGRLSFTLKGLQAKGLLPGVGVAETAVDLFDLEGSYDVLITKPGEIVNSFSVAVKDAGPALVSGIENEDTFLEIWVHDTPLAQ